LSAYDIVIIGGGIVGLATALSLSDKKNIKIRIIETEDRLAAHQTGNNSGVIHSGLYYEPESLKAKNCVDGRIKMYAFCKKHEIPCEQCGKLVVATAEKEMPFLEDLHERGIANGLQGLKSLNADELNEYEPHVKGIAGLLVPETGIVNYETVTDAFAQIISENGNEISLKTQFISAKRSQGSFLLTTTNSEIETKNIINCAGLMSDRVAKKFGVDPGLRIVPFRGEYYKLKPEKRHLVKNLIYPVPDPSFPFLGVHFTRMIDGEVEAGPNAVLAFKREGYSRFSFSLKDTFDTFTYPGFIKLGGKYLSMGLGEFYRSFVKRAFVKALQRLIPEITSHDIVSGGAGVRAQALELNGSLVDDFRIVNKPGMIHVLNAPSPAATAAISIGEKIADMAIDNFALR